LSASLDQLAGDRVLILDFGSQYTQLIARRVRELGIYAEIRPFRSSRADIEAFGAGAIILSGGPNSVTDEGAPTIGTWIYEQGVPVLGICYGLQLTCHLLGGKVRKSDHREYGAAQVRKLEDAGIVAGLDDHFGVWMSHGDVVESIPEGFVAQADTDSTPFAAIADEVRKIYGVQFHPEVHHTPQGKAMLSRFLFEICGLSSGWNMADFLDEKARDIQAQVGQDHVLCGLSGGVDSSVVAALLQRAIGSQLTCIFVDNGLLRHNERETVEAIFGRNFNANLVVVDAREQFLGELAGVTDPETKRKIIGRVFIEVFEAEAAKRSDAKWLAQGTLYPDVIESVSPTGGPSVTIKSHHNVGGLPERMGLGLVEPLRELFKDEVRALGRELGLPDEVIMRHPFPGPGLAVRCPGECSPERLATLRAADHIFMDELHRSGWYSKCWQALVVLLPVRSVGVMGDERTFEEVVSLRAVTSTDGMTADWVPLPYDLLGRTANRIINEVRGVNRVLFDVTSKPPGTIEWE
jgi:GMP synthase (glutamine-hydrolysing)